MAATVKDVAAKAGVSTATVSRVVNGDNRISDSTKLRVLEAIDELEYRVNHFAKGLKTRRSFTVGFICPEFQNDFYMGIASGVEKALKAHGYSVLLCNSDEDYQEEERRINLMIEKSVDGVIVLPVGCEGVHFHKLRHAGIPVVLVDRFLNDFQTDVVLVDNINGVYQALEAAIARGHRRIGFLGGDQRLTSGLERFEGYKRVLADYHIPFEPEVVRFGDFHIQSGYELMGELLSLPTPPRLIFVSNFFMQVGATKYLMEKKNKLREVPIMGGFDDMDISFALGYCHFAVRQPIYDIGHEAAELLLERMQSQETASVPRIVRLKTELVIREE